MASFPYQLRADLHWESRESQGRRLWLVRDVLSRQFYRFGEEEKLLLTWLDGKTSLAHIRDRFRATFPNCDISLEQILKLYQPMLAKGLLVPTPEALNDRTSLQNASQKKTSSSNRTSSFLSIGWLFKFISQWVSIRIPGPNPDRFLARVAPSTDWLFSRQAVMFWMTFVAFSAALVLTRLPQVIQAIPSFDHFFQLSTLTGLTLLFVITRGIHEMGHGLICKRLNARCPEVGLLIMVGIPCVYCDTTDSWRLPNRWHRAAVAAGGMYVELILASCAALFWFSASDGPVRNMALQVMLVCSVSTWLFNANPLMKYDGYYILSDLLDAPNLRDQADKQLLSILSKWILGIKNAWFRPFRPLPVLPMVGFSLASTVYRVVLTLSIAGSVWWALSSWQLDSLGAAVAVILSVGGTAPPVFKFGKWLDLRVAAGEVSRFRAYSFLSLIVLLFMLLLFAPLPNRITTTGRIVPRSQHAVYVETAGLLSNVSISQQQTVNRGNKLFELTNSKLLIEHEQARGKAESAKIQLDLSRRASLIDSEVSSQIPTLQAAMEASAQQANTREQEVKRLQITASHDGLFQSAMLTNEAELDTHVPIIPNLSSLDVEQLGRWMPVGTLLGHIITDSTATASIDLDDHSAARIPIGCLVHLQSDAFPGEVIQGRIVEIAVKEEAERNDRSSIDSLATDAARGAQLTDAPKRFIARIEFLEQPARAIWDAPITAVLHAKPRSLADRLIDWGATTFRRPL